MEPVCSPSQRSSLLTAELLCRPVSRGFRETVPDSFSECSQNCTSTWIPVFRSYQTRILKPGFSLNRFQSVPMVSFHPPIGFTIHDPVLASISRLIIGNESVLVSFAKWERPWFDTACQSDSGPQICPDQTWTSVRFPLTLFMEILFCLRAPTLSAYSSAYYPECHGAKLLAQNSLVVTERRYRITTVHHCNGILLHIYPPQMTSQVPSDQGSVQVPAQQKSARYWWKRSPWSSSISQSALRKVATIWENLPSAVQDLYHVSSYSL